MNVFNITIVLVVVCIILMITLLTTTIIFINVIKKLINKIDDQSRVIYFIEKRDKRIESDIADTQEVIVSLSTSVKELLSDYKDQITKKIYPKPELVEQITQTISDLLTIEVQLSKRLKVSRKESVQLIVQNTANTYPDVDTEYITKKTLAMIEAYTSDAVEDSN